MQNRTMGQNPWQQLSKIQIPRQMIIGIILSVALIAFEIFNFDTTRYALRDLLGDIRFADVEWAAILAIAFCSIDFAGLMRMFTLQEELRLFVPFVFLIQVV